MLRGRFQKLRWAMVIGFLALMWQFAPPQLGGTMAWVSTVGNSMEPEIKKGDLALIKRADNYMVGDVIASRNKTLNTIVLHRIHRIDENGVITTKGDHNTWIDADHPTEDNIIGEMIYLAPGWGKRLSMLRTPGGFIAVALLVVAIVFIQGERRKKRENSEYHFSAPELRRHDLAVNAKSWIPPDLPSRAAAGGLAFFVVLGVLVFSQSSIKPEAREIPYDHRGVFEYSAAAGGGDIVYEGGRVKTGDPVFLRLASKVDFTFAYEFDALAKSQVSGEKSMNAVVSDANGWSHTLIVTPAKEFTGKKTKVSGSLDLAEVLRYVEQVESLTGIDQPAYTITIRPRIDANPAIGDVVVHETFAPQLQFRLDVDQLQLQASANANNGNQLRPGKGDTLKTSIGMANPLNIFGLKLNRGGMRPVSILGILLSLVALISLRRQRRGQVKAPATTREHDGIHYREGVITVNTPAMPKQSTVIKLGTFEDLVRLAENYGAIILHHQSDEGHTYFVETNGLLHRYDLPHDEVEPIQDLPAQDPSQEEGENV